MSGLLEHRLRYCRWDGMPADFGPGEVDVAIAYDFKSVDVRVMRRNSDGFLMPSAELTPEAARILAAELLAIADLVEGHLRRTEQ